MSEKLNHMEKQDINKNKKTSKCNARYLAQGFTMMELIVVVILFAVIAGFAIPGFDKTIRRSHERSAILFLTSLHLANEIYEVKMNEFLPGAGLSLAQINSGLEINIQAQNMTYSYTRSAVDAYKATAAWSGSTNFTIRVNEQSMSSANNPCCSAGSCPTMPGC